jgi:anti-sigma factor RsiW
MAEREDRFEAGDAVEVAAPCGRRFSEELLSGYLDGALTQGEEQRVRLHLEDCPACRALYTELTTLRETTMKTRFVLPADDQWDERPRSSLSRLFRGTGWTLTVGWLVALALFTAWQLATGPESALEKLAIFGGVSAVAVLFLSVLIDRLRVLPGDRYRRVKK